MEIKNLTEEEIGFEKLNDAKDIVKKIFAAHNIVLPEIEVFCGDYDTPYYHPIGSVYQRGNNKVVATTPVIDLSIPSDVKPSYLKPMLIYQLSHEYIHSFVSEHLLRGSVQIINELLAAAASHRILIESGFDWYEKLVRKGQAVSPAKLYNYIKIRENTIFKDPTEVYKKHGCYLGLVSSKIDIWTLIKELKKALQTQSKESALDLEWLHNTGFFNLLT